jgi:hypothetical protein
VDDLITFLRQQLDEDERVARAADPGPWAVIPCESETAAIGHTSGPHPMPCVVHRDEYGDGIKVADAEHIARWDPARVLAEVEVKRCILDEILRYEAKIDSEWGCCHSAEAIAAGQCPETKPSDIPAIRLLAQPYAGRDGWREEWRA